MSTTLRLTAAQALVRLMAAQHVTIDGADVPIFAGVWAIFGHGNVAGMSAPLHEARATLPIYRAHNEQAMALAATAFAKATRRRRMMACTTSIGPGATNLVTAAAVAHANRLPLLLIPGDVFANRRPDPVLQQIENISDATVSANDCLRPVSRYFDRITRAEQIIPAFERAMQVLTDSAECGPVTLAFCQDVQTEAFDVPKRLLEPRVWHQRRPRPDPHELRAARAAISVAKAPFIIAGGGVLYSAAENALIAFAARCGIPIAETQAGKSAVPASHAMNAGSIGVTGTSAANALARDADLIIAVGTRLQDFTTGSWSLFENPKRQLLSINVSAFDAGKHRATSIVADARMAITELDAALAGWSAPAAWTERVATERHAWDAQARTATAPPKANTLPADAHVIGAVQRAAPANTILVGAAGGLPGELHKLWHAEQPGGYHMEYGYSCMGYEIAGGLGVKMAKPDAPVVVMVGDGSYLMMNSEIATSVLLGLPLVIVVLDNGGFGCISRLQRATTGLAFNNLFETLYHVAQPVIDFAAHARSLGADATHVASITDLETAVRAAITAKRTTVVVITTDPHTSTEAGGHWWDVAVPEVAADPATRRAYDTTRTTKQRLGD